MADRPLYLVVDADGVPSMVGDSLKKVVAEAAREYGEDHVYADPDQLTPMRENPDELEDGGWSAYLRTNLPLACLGKYGSASYTGLKWPADFHVRELRGQAVPGVPRKLLESMTIDQAADRVRAALPQSWHKMTGEVVSTELFTQNAKTKKTDADLPYDADSWGMALAPHQIGLRHTGSPSARGFRPSRIEDNEAMAAVQSSSVMTSKELAIGGRSGLPPLLDPGGEVAAAARRYPFYLHAKSTLCAGASHECRTTCLMFSGNNPLRDAAFVSKVALTQALYLDPAAFMRLVLHGAVKKWASADAAGMKSYMRLNLLSDIPWELLAPDLYRTEWPWKLAGTTSSRAGCWYDYTKVPNRDRSRYDQTFSFNGNNELACDAELNRGGRVAVVFIRAFTEREGPGKVTGKDREGRTRTQWHAPALTKGSIVLEMGGGRTAAARGVQKRRILPWTWRGRPVVNGDVSDIRALDDALYGQLLNQRGGYVIGLDFKGARRYKRVFDEAGRPVMETRKSKLTGDEYTAQVLEAEPQIDWYSKSGLDKARFIVRVHKVTDSVWALAASESQTIRDPADTIAGVPGREAA